jgi:hypothetical protein
MGYDWLRAHADAAAGSSGIFLASRLPHGLSVRSKNPRRLPRISARGWRARPANWNWPA